MENRAFGRLLKQLQKLKSIELVETCPHCHSQNVF